MHFVIKLFPEIIIKSAPVRKRFTRQLFNNVRLLLKRVDDQLVVRRDWEKLEVVGPDDAELCARVAQVLANTPGIAFFYQVTEFEATTLDDIYQRTAEIWGDQLAEKSFCIRAKRTGNHEFSSVEIERYVGGGLNQNFATGGVRLKQPDITVKLELKQNTLYVVREQIAGLGGFPLGTQEPVLSLISGGFDSTVATYLTIKRGIRCHYVFFNMGGRAHEVGCKEIAHLLWQKYGSSHQVKFISVPFEGVVAEILNRVSQANMGVVLKRMMYRAASAVAEQLKVDALVTGESVAQVSSQTIANLSVIERAIETLVLRPLITSDKNNIIATARAIGTEELAANIPEYCGVISKKPTTHAKLDRVLEEEASFDFGVLDDALNRLQVQSIANVLDATDYQQADEFAYVPTDAQVIDIRHPDEQEQAPMTIVGTEVHVIPFYTLSKAVAQLNPQQQYLLFCDRGVMSRLHAGQLNEEGYPNIGVYRPNP